MFLPMFRIVARPSASWAASPGMAPKTLFQYVEATTGIWLMVKYLLSTSKVDASAGMRIVDGGAKDKAICLLGGSDQLVHHVVVKGAAAIELAALATANAVANGLGAQLEHLGIDALGVELLGDLGECAGGIAVCLGTAIDQKNLHHKLPLLSVTSAEDYRTIRQMARGAIRNGSCFTSRPTTLVQFGARYLRRFFK